jgi:hypothetical protein
MKLVFAVFAVIASSILPAYAGVELIGQPARARNILDGRIVTDPHTGKEILLLSNNNEASNAELIFVDFEKDTATVVRAESGAGAEAILQIGDRLVLGTFFDGSLIIFDLNQMRFVKSISFPGEKYVWGFAIGSDGRLYCGTYPGGKLGALDLSTYVLEDLGGPIPRDRYLRSLMTLLDGRILCRFLADDPAWLVFDPASKKFSPIPDALRTRPKLATWNGFLVAGNRFLDRAFHPVSPLPLQNRRRVIGKGTPQLGTDWEVEQTLTTPDTLYMRQGQNLWRYRKNSADVEFVTSVDLRGGRLLSELRDGRLIGVRGQAYFVLRPGDTKLDLRPIPGESAPRFIGFLRSDPEGRIWGGPPYGQTLFEVDPQTREVVNTDTISDIGGEVYDAAFLNGITYAAAYSGGEVIRYDRRAPWDQWHHTNPTTIASVGAAGFNRPSGGIIVGPGQKLYSGWMAGLGTFGGAVAITDPVTGATEILKNPLGEQPIAGIATDGRLLYIGSTLDPDAPSTTPESSARFGIIDPVSRAVISQQEVAGAQRVRVIGFDASTQVVVTIVDGQIRLFDTLLEKFVPTSVTKPPVASWISALPGNGILYYGSGKQVLALDLRAETITVLGDVPAYVNNVTIGPSGDLYIGGWMNLYVLRGNHVGQVRSSR